MSEEWKRKRGRAAKLAAWTRLAHGEFIMCYAIAWSPPAKDWRVIEADVGPAADPKALVREACRVAEEHGFLGKLAFAIARIESGVHRRSDEDIAAMFAQVGEHGIMQAITNRARALMDASIFNKLAAAADACAVVMENGDTRGTAFLVRRDMVLTAAHVVLDEEPDGEGGLRWKDTLRKNLSLSFVAPPESQEPRLTVPVQGDAPVMASPPHGDPPDVLNRELDAEAPLDFALVRLSQQVHHVDPLDVRQPEEPGRYCFVLGYLAGTGLKFDGDDVVEIQNFGRFLHRVNTEHGMSGGCCIGPDGTVIAIHEGALAQLDAGGQPKRDARNRILYDNRAVSLAKIRAMQAAQTPDPLDDIALAPGLAFANPKLVDGLFRAGLHLAGAALADRWRASFQGALGLDKPYAEGDPLPEFHPWIPRPMVEDWYDEALTDPKARLCFVNGPRGSGKSFCTTIIAAKVSDPQINLVRLTPTQTSTWSWEEAISPALRGGDFLLQDSAPATRLRAAAIKYDDLPDVVEALSWIRGQKRTAKTPLFVVVDFEEGDGLRTERSHWYAFIEALAKEEWARQVLIGLSDHERLQIGLSFKTNEQLRNIKTTSVSLTHLTVLDVVSYLLDLAASRNVSIDGAAAAGEVQKIWDSPLMLHPQQVDLQTVDAALCAILLERGVKDA